tara:strand:- start:1560 stop:2309 length:750 start_codon:yes stop_codon:yes gene_type:complete
MPIVNEYGLLNAHEGDIVSENCPLFSLENIILKIMLGKDSSDMEEKLIAYIEKMRNHETKRFNNIPFITEGPDKFISHDQYTSICAYSAYRGLNFHKEFWKEVEFGTYNNLERGFHIKHILHPRDYIYIGYLNDNIFCKLLMPLFCLMIVESFWGKYKVRPTLWARIKSGFSLETRKMIVTEGELLGLVRKVGLKDKSFLFNWTWKVCMWRMKSKFPDGYKGVFRKYFWMAPHHENIELADQLTTIHDI